MSPIRLSRVLSVSQIGTIRDGPSLITFVRLVQLEPIGDGPSLITVGIRPDGFRDRADNGVDLTPESTYVLLYGEFRFASSECPSPSTFLTIHREIS
jgi:hypothetical protein